jgi:tRNA pseudouridine55 synthase
VLVLAIGHATRLLPLVTPSDKRYAFELRLGASTDTADATGHVLETAPVPDDWSARLPAIAVQMIGPLEQVPPMFSAVKIAGRPLYVSARRGQQIARAARPTRVLSLRVVATTQHSARMIVECEAGLYVRSLCEEIGKRLGTLAHMGTLVRTAAGPFSIDTASLPADIAEHPQACLLDPRSVLALRTVELDAPTALRFMNGNAVAQASETAAKRDSQTIVLVLHGNRCIGVGSLAVGGELSPRRVFD